ncbi:MAG: hypothetical protein HUU10_12730 [Bacteroidetes bacterium]|nr:hypothetical protein [Bacteroidota bacterium]
MQNTDLPRILWMYWHQGADQAPHLVKTCIDSWKSMNPGWDLRLLDQNSMKSYMEWTFPVLYDPVLSIVANSELLRVNLLSRYGGVWADATCLCLQPLDEWIDKAMGDGFFAFSNPGADRLLSSWFLAAVPGNPLVLDWKNRSNRYWKEHAFPTRAPASIQKFSGRLFSRTTSLTWLWFTPVVSKWLKLYPYYWFHYQFERVVSSSHVAATIWKNRVDFEASIPHFFQLYGLYKPYSDDIHAFLDSQRTPMAKLTWKIKPARYKPGVVLYELIEPNGIRSMIRHQEPVV